MKYILGSLLFLSCIATAAHAAPPPPGTKIDEVAEVMWCYSTADLKAFVSLKEQGDREKFLRQKREPILVCGNAIISNVTIGGFLDLGTVNGNHVWGVRLAQVYPDGKWFLWAEPATPHPAREQ